MFGLVGPLTSGAPSCSLGVLWAGSGPLPPLVVGPLVVRSQRFPGVVRVTGWFFRVHSAVEVPMAPLFDHVFTVTSCTPYGYELH